MRTIAITHAYRRVKLSGWLMHKRIFTFLALVALSGCATLPVGDTVGPVGLELIADDLDQPVFVTSPPGDSRLFVVEQDGLVLILGEETPPFLDVRSLVSTRDHEQGLLGLAFHPDYARNGLFYINYTGTDDNTRIVEYRASGNRNLADSSSARTLLTIEQPTRRHNGGWIGFGPDGLLYASSGDGTNSALGPIGDPSGHGQNPSNLLGTIYRIDVDRGGPPQVVAYGLRNPWRASFDGDRLWLGDVGQNAWEEIDNFTIGQSPNFGWNMTEGDHCFQEGCDPSLYTAPIYEYSHEEGCAVTGGYVYRGSIHVLRGHYLFADYCFGWVRSIDVDGPTSRLADWSQLLGGRGPITSFGVDAYGELYIVIQSGAIYKIVAN